jgi:hypothetical protein
MKRNLISILAGAGVFLACSCAHRQIDASSVQDVTRLAVVVRASPGPTVSSSEPDKTLVDMLGKQVTVFELEERVRESVMARMPAAPPWSSAMPAAQVATALQSFLVVDRSLPLDVDALRAAGADAVLELRITEWGVTSGAKPALYLKGQGSLYRLPGKGGIWADKLDTELSDSEGEAVDLAALKNGGYREAVIRLVGRVAERIAAELGGKQP